MTRTSTITSPRDEAASIQCPAGFAAGGLSCGIKASGADDLAMIICPGGATAAAVFTRNLVHGAPIVLSRRDLAKSQGRIRGLVIDSGCANAATGAEGLRRAQRVIDAAAACLKSPAEQVLTNSTGVIGEHLPDDLITKALPKLFASCATDGLTRAATAIMTTDTRVKMTQQIVQAGGRACRVVGIAKGAGMIHPNMATMIAVIMTDAAASAPALDCMLRSAVERSFHRITVDGDTSTNDAVFLLASGQAGEFAADDLAPAVEAVSRELAKMIVCDGEGASRLIRVQVTGAHSEHEALEVARTVASSLLVRTSVAGGDPNWGRILAAAGRSGVDLDPDRLTLTVNGLPMFEGGRPTETPKRLLEAAYSQGEVVLSLDLARGEAAEEFLTCDLTEQYVRVNADYTS